MVQNVTRSGSRTEDMRAQSRYAVFAVSTVRRALPSAARCIAIAAAHTAAADTHAR
jgi:hypothetical protein